MHINRPIYIDLYTFIHCVRQRLFLCNFQHQSYYLCRLSSSVTNSNLSKIPVMNINDEDDLALSMNHLSIHASMHDSLHDSLKELHSPLPSGHTNNCDTDHRLFSLDGSLVQSDLYSCHVSISLLSNFEQNSPKGNSPHSRCSAGSSEYASGLSSSLFSASYRYLLAIHLLFLLFL